MNGVNMTFWVYQGDDHPKSDQKFDRNAVFQLKLTSAYRPSNDKEYDKMYDVINKWGSERRIGKLDDSDVDIYFEEFIAEQDEDTEKLKNQLDQKDNEIAQLKQKEKVDKAKNLQQRAQANINPETGEPLLQVGIAYKHMRDKMKKEKMQEDADYLKPKMNPSQLANIKNVWKHKTKKDVTPAVQKMIKNMDIPTQLAIKQAKINVLSDLVEEAFAVQITKKDGGKLIHGKYKTKPDAEKFIKWYKTGDMKDTKSIEVVKEMAKDKAYAIGMATAKKKYNDEPPLDKKTIKKAHEIGDKLSKMKKENADHPAKMKFEQIAGLKKKAEKSGMPYGILKKVYDRGMAAWRGGHRPGTSQQQWAFARVNSFVTKSSGTWGGADKDLAKKVRSKK